MSAAVTDLADRYRLHLESVPDAGAQLAALAARSQDDPALRSVLAAPLLSRPMFLTAAERAELERDLAGLQALLLSLPYRLYGGDVARMCADLGFSPAQTMAVEETWQDTDVLLSRADLIRTADGFRAIEVNLHSSLGGIDSGPWHKAMLDVPAFASFAASEQLTYLDPLDGVAGVLHAAARRRGLGAFPSVALVDWPSSYEHTAPRLDRLTRLLARRGFDAFSCSAAELRVRAGRLVARGRPVDVCFRVFVLGDVLENPALLLPLLETHRAGTIVLAMSFVAELAGNKGCLAMLHDPRHAAQFSRAERALIERIVPWTRWVDGTVPTEPALPRTELVLKPAGGYSAQGVVAGWSLDEDGWRAALTAAAGRHYVLQRRARALPEELPAGGVVDTNWGVFLAGDRYNGAMIRAVPSAGQELITTSTGAAIGCCFTQRTDS